MARRAAVEGFLALAPDGLFPAGGYPGNDDDGRTLQAGLDQAKLRTDMVNSAKYLKAHALSSGKLGATGFCWGGGTTNFLAVTLGADLKAAVPYYGAAPAGSAVPEIKAPLLIQLAENDERAISVLRSRLEPFLLRRTKEDVAPELPDRTEIALACDLRVAADDAELTLGFSKIGLIPDGGASFMLPLLAGLGRALELAWTSEKIGAAEAQRIGLVNRVVPAADLERETQALAERFTRISPAAVGLTKRAFNRAVMPNFERWLEEEAELQQAAADGGDVLEGIRAFVEKRIPAYAK